MVCVKKVNVCGQSFAEELYTMLMTSFKESFSYSSLSVESAFEKLDDCEAKIHKIRNQKAYDYYQLLLLYPLLLN